MAKLDLNLSYISNVETSIKNTVNELSRRKSDYEGIAKDLRNINSSTGNLSNANIYLQKKNEKLQDKIDKLNAFKTKVTTFSSDAKEADGRVATYVTDSSDTFYKTVGIKTGWSGAWTSFKRGCKTAWKAVTDFYEKHKYLIDFIVDFGLLVVAVVSLVASLPLGFIAAFFAGFALAQALGDAVTSAAALGLHLAGDDEGAGIWAERGLKDGVMLLGRGADWLHEKVSGEQTHFYEGLFGAAYDVVNIASIGYSFYKSGKGIIGGLKNGNFRRTGIKGVKAVFGLNLTPGESKASYKAITNAFSFIKNGKQAYTFVRVCGYFKNVKTTVCLVNSIFNGEFTTKGLKVVKDVKSAWDSLTDAGRSIEPLYVP